MLCMYLRISRDGPGICQDRVRKCNLRDVFRRDCYFFVQVPWKTSVAHVLPSGEASHLTVKLVGPARVVVQRLEARLPSNVIPELVNFQVFPVTLIAPDPISPTLV